MLLNDGDLLTVPVDWEAVPLLSHRDYEGVISLIEVVEVGGVFADARLPRHLGDGGGHPDGRLPHLLVLFVDDRAHLVFGVPFIRLCEIETLKLHASDVDAIDAQHGREPVGRDMVLHIRAVPPGDDIVRDDRHRSSGDELVARIPAAYALFNGNVHGAFLPPFCG